jgi:hypothetical protein
VAEEKATPSKPKGKSVDEGDPQAPPGTPEHLGSDHPYQGGPYLEADEK